MPKPVTRIAIQTKGRLLEDSLAWLAERGITFNQKPDRALRALSDNDQVEAIFVRHSDIPKYVQSGVAQYGIVGANILHEYEPPVNTISRFSFGQCKLVLAVPAESDIRTIQDLAGHRIATAYPNSLRKWLRANGIPAAVIDLGGSIEVTTELGLADAICDITQTGTTLKQHQLEPMHTILESTATLIMSPHYQPASHDPIYATL